MSEQDLTNLYNVGLWFKIPNRCTCDVSSDSLLHLLIGDQSIDTEDEKLLDLFYHKDFLIRGYIKKKKKKKIDFLIMPQCASWIQKSLDACFVNSHKHC